MNRRYPRFVEWTPPPKPGPGAGRAAWQSWLAGLCERAAQSKGYYNDPDRPAMLERLRNLFLTDLECAAFCFDLMEKITEHRYDHIKSWWILVGGEAHYSIHNNIHYALNEVSETTPAETDPVILTACAQAQQLLADLIAVVAEQDHYSLRDWQKGFASGRPWLVLKEIQGRGHCGNGGIFDSCGREMYDLGPPVIDAINDIGVKLLQYLLPERE